MFLKDKCGGMAQSHIQCGSKTALYNTWIELRMSDVSESGSFLRLHLFPSLAFVMTDLFNELDENIIITVLTLHIMAWQLAHGALIASLRTAVGLKVHYC